VIARIVAIALICSTSGCNGCGRSRPTPILVDAAPPPSFGAQRPADASVEVDDLWKRAMAGDPMDVASLADREGAVGLLAGVEAGGDLGLAALRAMPHANDAELSLRRLAEIALQLDGAPQREVVEVIESIALRPARQTEVLDAQGARACADGLVELTKRGSVPKETRARAVNALRALSERLVVDPARIPAEFDPR